MLAPVYARLPLATLHALMEAGATIEPAGLCAPHRWVAEATPGQRRLLRRMLGESYVRARETDNLISTQFWGGQRWCLDLFADVSVSDVVLAQPRFLELLASTRHFLVRLTGVDDTGWAKALRGVINAVVTVGYSDNPAPDFKWCVEVIKFWLEDAPEQRAYQMNFHYRDFIATVHDHVLYIQVCSRENRRMLEEALPGVEIRE